MQHLMFKQLVAVNSRISSVNESEFNHWRLIWNWYARMRLAVNKHKMAVFFLSNQYNETESKIYIINSKLSFLVNDGAIWTWFLNKFLNLCLLNKWDFEIGYFLAFPTVIIWYLLTVKRARFEEGRDATGYPDFYQNLIMYYQSCICCWLLCNNKGRLPRLAVNTG